MSCTLEKKQCVFVSVYVCVGVCMCMCVPVCTHTQSFHTLEKDLKRFKNGLYQSIMEKICAELPM